MGGGKRRVVKGSKERSLSQFPGVAAEVGGAYEVHKRGEEHSQPEEADETDKTQLYFTQLNSTEAIVYLFPSPSHPPPTNQARNWDLEGFHHLISLAFC